MILYLVKSTLCIALLLAVYLIFLEKEKMHRFKRFYLLFGLIFSLMIPLIPIGMIDNFISLEMNTQSTIVNPGSNSTSTVTEESTYNQELTSESALSCILFPAIISMYGLITLILFLRLLCKIDSILFIEFLKTFFWFNPVLYFYKKAIQLNHEFLADEAAVTGSGLSSDYQFLLLKTTLLQNRHVLASNFNFSMTKKRLMMMMTQKTSRLVLPMKEVSWKTPWKASKIVWTDICRCRLRKPQ